MTELLRDNVYRALRHAIITCEFPPGQELREQVLAEKYRVSRSPIRDSLLRLEQERLVTVLPRQGYRVNPITTRDVEELFGLCLIIQSACAAEAAQADDLELRSLDRFRHAPGGDEPEVFLGYNRAFHRRVSELAGNARIAAVEAALAEESDRLVLVSLRAHRPASMTRVVAEHVGIIDAIQSHDSATAHRLTRKHLTAGQARIRAALDIDPTPEDDWTEQLRDVPAGQEASEGGSSHPAWRLDDDRP